MDEWGRRGKEGWRERGKASKKKTNGENEKVNLLVIGLDSRLLHLHHIVRCPVKLRISNKVAHLRKKEILDTLKKGGGAE